MKKAVQILLLSAFLLTFIVTKQLNVMRNIQDFTGRVIGKLTVIKKSTVKKYNQTTWECLCSCGNTTLVVTGSLNTGRIAGCLSCKSDNSTHKMTKTGAYRSWIGMRTRCTNENSADYAHYGGRGIKICDRWLESFENFYNDMGDRPELMTLERIEVDGNYDKSNCKWATVAEQNHNRRNNTYLVFNGEKLTQKQWCDRLGLKESTVHNRILRGMSISEALTTPVRHHNKPKLYEV